MDRRRFATRTAALLAAAAIAPLARAQAPAAPVDDKAAEEKAKKDTKPTGEQKLKQKAPAEEKKKTPEEQKLKNPGEQTNKSGANEEQKAKGSSPTEQKKKEKDEAAEQKAKSKGTLLDERWQREQDAKLAAAMRRVGKRLA